MTDGAATSYTHAYTSQATGRRTHISYFGTYGLLAPDQFDFSKSTHRFLHLGLPGIHKLMDAPLGSEAVGGLGSTSPTLSPTPNPHSVRGTPGAHSPRLRASALFGRRPLGSVDNPVIAGIRPNETTAASQATIRRQDGMQRPPDVEIVNTLDGHIVIDDEMTACHREFGIACRPDIHGRLVNDFTRELVAGNRLQYLVVYMDLLARHQCSEFLSVWDIGADDSLHREFYADESPRIIGEGHDGRCSKDGDRSSRCADHGVSRFCLPGSPTKIANGRFSTSPDHANAAL
jgi:hypothetical protein